MGVRRNNDYGGGQIIMERILIRHLSGSKANQVEPFVIDGLAELTFGRDPASQVTFDPERDDIVSRHHAAISIENQDQPRFKISDLNSSNGTFVNGSRITEPFEIFPGDVIEFGAGGPKISFDVDPRPEGFAGRTRVFDEQGAASPEPQAEGTSTAEAPSAIDRPIKTAVGRQTLERLIYQERSKTSRTWMYGLAAVVALITIASGLLFFQNLRTKEHMTASVEQAQAALSGQLTERAGAMSPKEIASKYGNAVVFIKAHWRVYHSQSGKQVFHKHVNGGTIPAYVEVPNHGVVRWLTTNDENQSNPPIGEPLSGSGFAAQGGGFILTNKHVAAGWLTNYQFADYEQCDHECGRLFQIGQKGTAWQQAKPILPMLGRNGDDLYGWRPHEGYLFQEKTAIPSDLQGRPFDRKLEGRAELSVQFPGQTSTVYARLIRYSENADMALIKVEAAYPLTSTVVLAASTAPPPSTGERVTIMGYPELSDKNFAHWMTAEAGKAEFRHAHIPEPTVTQSIISNIGRGPTPIVDKFLAFTSGEMGEVLQLSDSPGSGGSGGPVFDNAGKVIGVYTYHLGGYGHSPIGFAVPIKYGHELLKVQGRIN